MSATNSIGATANSADTTANPNSTLTQADFLQLLVTQMTSQDPLNPESDTDFAAQLAQFSNLQETTNVAGGVSALQASALIGMTVNVNSGTAGSASASGIVTGVDMSQGTPEIQINGNLYGLNQITSVIPTPTAATASSAATVPTAQVKP